MALKSYEVDTLTETECAKMLNAIKKKYGDD